MAPAKAASSNRKRSRPSCNRRCIFSTSSSARKRSSTSPAVRQTRSRPCVQYERSARRPSVCKRGPMGAAAFDGRNPRQPRRWRERPRLSHRGLQRAWCGRRLHERADERLAYGAGLAGNARPTPMPAARSPYRAMAARLPIRLGKNCSSSSSAASSIRRCARTANWNRCIGRPTAPANGRTCACSLSITACSLRRWRRTPAPTRPHRRVQGTVPQGGAASG